jgi:predicted  nucleic acid-binding Zn-ribbon protein
LEEELESIREESRDMQLELMEHKSEISALREKLVKTEDDAAKAHRALTAEREARELLQSQRLEDEKARQADERVQTPDSLYQHFRTQSPTTNTRTRQGFNESRASPQTRRPHGLAISTPGQPSPHERSLSRRSSGQPLPSSEFCPPSRQESFPFIPQLSVNGGVPNSPSLCDHPDDLFDGIKTPATPERTIHDMISVSTAGAGPSVQLVERMSAAMRRLESEKAASKDEVARLSVQRDEAREQVVSLMKEAEGKRAAEDRIRLLEAEVQRVNKQYLDASEMLGEKLERVEELEADVQELKHIYRELVERTVQ